MKRNIRILLVEDNKADYVLFKNILYDIQDYDFDLQWTSNYEDALSLMRQNIHDIYILDYLLVNHTGLDLLKEALNWGCEAPIIILTGMGNHEVDIYAMETGAADFLIKDKIDSEILERSIRYSLERNANLKALRESEAKYRTVFETSRDMIFITNEKGDFIDFNDSARRIFGYSREQFFKLSLSTLFYNEEEGEIFHNDLRLTGTLTNNEAVLKNKDGMKLYCLISASFKRSSEGEWNIFGIIHDITRRKKAEQDLVIAEKIAITGRLAQMLAHEIRNPLTTINLIVSKLEYDFPGKENMSTFNLIKNNSRRIDDLVREVLSLSSPEKIKMGKHNLNNLIDETLDFAMDRINLKNIKIKKMYSADVCDIIADEAKIKTAFLNIIINAIEAIPEEGGVLTIKTGKKGGKCFVEIEDNGAGISKDNLRKLFEPYFTRKPNGFGFGLSSTHNIIQSHNGSIDVESELKKGTKFIIGLNLSLTDVAASNAESNN